MAQTKSKCENCVVLSSQLAKLYEGVRKERVLRYTMVLDQFIDDLDSKRLFLDDLSEEVVTRLQYWFRK